MRSRGSTEELAALRARTRAIRTSASGWRASSTSLARSYSFWRTQPRWQVLSHRGRGIREHTTAPHRSRAHGFHSAAKFCPIFYQDGRFRLPSPLPEKRRRQAACHSGSLSARESLPRSVKPVRWPAAAGTGSERRASSLGGRPMSRAGHRGLQRRRRTIRHSRTRRPWAPIPVTRS